MQGHNRPLQLKDGTRKIGREGLGLATNACDLGHGRDGLLDTDLVTAVDLAAIIEPKRHQCQRVNPRLRTLDTDGELGIETELCVEIGDFARIELNSVGRAFERQALNKRDKGGVHV